MSSSFPAAFYSTLILFCSLWATQRFWLVMDCIIFPAVVIWRGGGGVSEPEIFYTQNTCAPRHQQHASLTTDPIPGGQGFSQARQPLPCSPLSVARLGLGGPGGPPRGAAITKAPLWVLVAKAEDPPDGASGRKGTK